MSGYPMALKVIKKIKSKLKFVHRKNGKMARISKNEFETLNWLPVRDQILTDQFINSIFLIYFTK